jgi:hypothetical protein
MAKDRKQKWHYNYLLIKGQCTLDNAYEFTICKSLLYLCIESSSINDLRNHSSIRVHRIADYDVENDSEVVQFVIKFLVICNKLMVKSCSLAVILVICDKLMDYDMNVIVGITRHS